jgi:cell division protease FtsH
MSSHEKPGLPDGRVAPQTYRSRERDEDRPTRKPLPWWDRVKILLFLAAAWFVLLWAEMAGDPLLTFRDGVALTLRAHWWVLALAAVEALRQLHYLVSERWAGYHRFWTQRVFGGLERRARRMNDWDRFRLARVAKWVFVLVVADLVLAAWLHLPAATALFHVPRLIIEALPFFLLIVFYIILAVSQFIGIFYFLSRGGIEVYMPDDIKTRFTDVWGQDHVLEKVKENIVFLENPESIEEKGGYVPGGILLWGPPGTGKTLMAQAVAGETEKPFVFVEPGAFINTFFGIGLLKMYLLWRRLRKLALRYGGVVAFFDEADSLGNRGALQPTGPWGQRTGAFTGPWAAAPSCNGMSYLSEGTVASLLQSSLAQSVAPEPPRRWRDGIIFGLWGRGDPFALQRLLTEMDGLKKPRGFFNRRIRRLLGMRPKPPPKYRILTIFATNLPQALDEALLRPGRIDRIYKVGYPSKAGRIRTYEGYFAKVKHTLTPEDIDRLATITPYFSGAMIKDLVNEALINAIREGRDVIEWQDVLKAKRLKELGPPEDVEYIERERHAVAVHEACHAVVAYKVRRHLTIDLATIEKGGTFLGMVHSVRPEDIFTQWRSDFEADIMVSLASLAGERMFFEGDSSSGVSNDLESATRIATLMEGYWGMGSTLAVHGVIHEVGIGLGGRQGGDGQGRRGRGDSLFELGLGNRIERKLEELLRRTEELLAENRRAVLSVAHALETHKTISGEDLAAVIEGRPGPVIDGRLYLDDEFYRRLEEYHAEAVRAHKAHSSVGMPLPALVPAVVFPDAVSEDGPAGKEEPTPVGAGAEAEADPPADSPGEPTADPPEGGGA